MLLTSPLGRYEHDELGRPTRLEGPSGATAYSYDDLGRLVRVGLPEGSSVEFSYDALYRRRTKTTLTGIRRTVWAGDVPLEESLPHGGSIKYLYDPVSEAPLAVEIGGEWHYSLELAKRARTAVRPRGEADVDKERALVEGLEAARVATAEIDTEIARLERQRDLLHDRLADLDGRSSAPVSLVDVLRVRALDRLEKQSADGISVRAPRIRPG